MGTETWTYAYISTADKTIGEVYRNLQNILVNLLTVPPQANASERSPQRT